MSCPSFLARPHLVLLSAVLSVAACGDDGGAAQSDGSSGGSGSDGSTSLSSTTTDGSSTTATTTDDTTDPPMGECIPWENGACGSGRKCMPYSVEQDRLPDFFQCCDALGVDLPGEPCEIMDYDGSCLDTCAEGSMCVLDNPDELLGQCRGFCNPSTGGPCGNDQTCKSFFELLPGVVTTPLCMDKCDPLVQDCLQEGWQCIPDTPTESGQSGFLCTPPSPNPPKNVLEPCALANDCEAGLACIPDDRVPDCSFTACCSAYCSVSEGDATCQAIHPDLHCVDWMSPDPTWSDVGVCAIPT